MSCNKKKFSTEIEAQNKIEEIKLSNKKGYNPNKKPIRSYKCSKCDCYHLTSQSHNKYNSRKQNYSKAIQKDKEEKFINREAEYYNKKFGIED